MATDDRERLDRARHSFHVCRNHVLDLVAHQKTRCARRPCAVAHGDQAALRDRARFSALIQSTESVCWVCGGRRGSYALQPYAGGRRRISRNNGNHRRYGDGSRFWAVARGYVELCGDLGAGWRRIGAFSVDHVRDRHRGDLLRLASVRCHNANGNGGSGDHDVHSATRSPVGRRTISYSAGCVRDEAVTN